MLRMLFAVLAFFCAIECESVFAFEGKCKIQIRGKSYLDGKCNVEIESDGGMTVGVGDSNPSKYFSYVVVNEKGMGRGSWNGRSAESHAHESLGDLKRSGSCWVNKIAKICGEKLTE